MLAGRRALVQRAGPAVRVFLVPGEPVALDLHRQPAGERVDDGDADAVQAAGHRVGLAVELAAGVQRGQHDLDRRPLLDRVPVDRDAPAVVGDAHPAVGHQRHHDRVADAGHRLVDRVVHHLLDQVVEPPLPGRSDVHSRALANCFQTLENGDRARVVVRRRCLGSHARSLPPARSGGTWGRHAGGGSDRLDAETASRAAGAAARGSVLSSLARYGLQTGHRCRLTRREPVQLGAEKVPHRHPPRHERSEPSPRPAGRGARPAVADGPRCCRPAARIGRAGQVDPATAAGPWVRPAGRSGRTVAWR